MIINIRIILIIFIVLFISNFIFGSTIPSVLEVLVMMAPFSTSSTSRAKA